MTKTESLKLEAEMTKRWTEDPESNEFKAKEALFTMLYKGRDPVIAAATLVIMEKALGKEIDRFDEVDYWQQILGDSFVSMIATVGLVYTLDKD